MKKAKCFLIGVLFFVLFVPEALATHALGVKGNYPPESSSISKTNTVRLTAISDESFWARDTASFSPGPEELGENLFADPWGAPIGNFHECLAYSNGNYSNAYLGRYGYRYQCVEWVNRFYVQMMVHKNMRGMGNAEDYYDNYLTLGLCRYPNGGTESPRPGDILCSNGGDFGHVAVVREVGSNYVKVIQQNWFNDSRDNNMQLGMTVSGGHYTVAGFSASYPVQGWLRLCNLPDVIHHIEDNWGECTRYGTPADWHEYTYNSTDPNSKIGFCRGHAYWTYSNGNNIDNYAIWRPNLSSSGNYEVFAFIPEDHATTTNASYEIHYDGGSTIRVVNQSNYYGVFVSLGTYQFSAGTNGYVKLADNTGEAVGTKKIGFDDVVFVLRTPPSQTLSVTLDANPSNGCAPLYVNLTADVSGTATGTINYTFWWNCDNPGNSVEEVTAVCGDPTNPAIGEKYNDVWDDPKIVDHTYSAAGTYIAKVIAERGSAAPAEARTTITVEGVITLQDGEITPTGAKGGRKVTFQYTISNSTSTPAIVTLGAQIRRSGKGEWYDDHTGDETVSVPPGVSYHERSYHVPPNGNVHYFIEPGLYDARWVIYNAEMADTLTKLNYFTVQPFEVATLSNGTIEVGVNLDWGGVISTINYQGKGTNLIDSYDPGRFAQVSFWDGNDTIPPIQWNPVLAGDDSGNASPIVTQYIGSDSIYTKTRLLNYWKSGDTTDVYLEQSVILVESTVVKVHYKMIYAGTESHVFWDQEFPCAYISGNLTKLIYYAGSNPWDNELVTEYAIPANNQNFYFTATEYWASFVNDQNVGLTLFSEDSVDYWVAARFDFTTEPSYLTTVPQFAIIPGTVKEATEYYIAGDYHDARAYIYDLFTSVDSSIVENNLPQSVELQQNYPNPFNPQTIIKYTLPKNCQVKIAIYNILGQKVRTLIDQYQTKGQRRVYWDGKDDQGSELTSGIYFYRLQTSEFSQTKKMVLLR